MKNYGICQLSVVPVRKSPVSTSEMITQIIFGEIFSIVKHEEKWSIVSNEFDNYQGWVNNSQIKFIEKKDFELLKSNMPVYCLDNKGYIKNSNKEIISVPLGSLISSCFFLETIYFGNTSISTKNDLIKNAKLFLNAPYLWGGRIPYGIDCSGFSQIVYKIHGIKINRDANQQLIQGKKIDINKVSNGDLAFFGDSIGSITHVGIMLNKDEIIHAYGKVRIDKINNDGIINSETKKITHRLIEFRSY
jgi:hypothetical protein